MKKNNTIKKIAAIVAAVALLTAGAEELTARKLAEYSAEDITAAAVVELAGATVYTTAKGERFHIKETCAPTASAATLGEAVNAGKTPCGKCCRKIADAVNGRTAELAEYTEAITGAEEVAE